MHTILSILSSIPALIAIVIATIVTLYGFWLRSDNFRFLNFKYTFPIHGSGEWGKLKKLQGKMRAEDEPLGEQDDLTEDERELCNDFKSAITGAEGAEVTPHQFKRAQDYLRLTEQDDTRPIGMLSKIGLFALILAEAVGTGYVLAPFMSQEITASQANIAAGILALAAAIILATLTHLAGEAEAKISAYKNKSGNIDVDEAIKIGLAEDQDTDQYRIDENGNIVQHNLRARFTHRISKPKEGHLAAVSSAILIVILMGVLFGIRYEGVKQTATQKAVQLEQNGFGGDSANPFASDTPAATGLPPDVAQNQMQSRKNVAESLSNDFFMQGVNAAIALSLIYLITQGLSFWLAFKSSFVGSGKFAYEFTRGEPSFDVFYQKYIAKKIDRVDSLLAALRSAREGRRKGKSTFKEYIKKGEKRETEQREECIKNAATMIANALDKKEELLIDRRMMLCHKFSPEEAKDIYSKVRVQRALRQDLQGSVSGNNSSHAPISLEPVTPTPQRPEPPPIHDSATQTQPSPVSQPAAAFDAEKVATEIYNLSSKDAKKARMVKLKKDLSVDDYQKIVSAYVNVKESQKKKQDAEIDGLLSDD